MLQLNLYTFFQLTMMEKFMWKPVSYKQNVNSNSKPCPRWGHCCCTIGNDIVLFGGYAESVYMNDLWIFDTVEMQWSEVKTKGTGPTPRSNCSASYDSKNNRIIFFGGGGSNKMRYNSIYVLDWETKTWSEIKYQQNAVLPWERTYHTAQLLYPYLVVYGGQGLADLDDLWVYNFETSKWKQIKTPKQKVKPCGRRFHSSCLIGNEFYVIAGCHTKYRCLNDIYSIDLTELLKSDETQNLVWRERSIKGTALLSRWGHSSVSYDSKIYIFGGRFSTDLNDLLIFDSIKETLKILKVSSDSLPKPRRRPSTCFVGSCLLMFGGFNSDYYNDLHFINVAEPFVKPKAYTPELKKQGKLQYIHKIFNTNSNYQFDYFLQSSENKLLPCFKDLLSSSDEEWQKIEDFLISIDGQLTYNKLVEIIQTLYLGYGQMDILEKHNIILPANQQQKIQIASRNIQQKLAVSCLSCISKSKSSSGIIELNDQKFGEMIQKNREMLKKDVAFVINNSFVLESNRNILSLNSKFFRAILNNYKQKKEGELIKLNMPSNNIVLFEILLNSITFGVLTVPQDMSYQSWIQLYSLAEYFCMPQMQKVCIYQISLRIDDKSVQKIYKFANNEQIEDLGSLCARYKIKNTNIIQQNSIKQKYMKKVYELYKFQIMQKGMVELQPKLHKHKSDITNGTQGEKQNYQICN